MDSDTKVMYITATSFPDGVMAAFDKLYALIPPDGNRRIFGISRPEKGVITYRAGAEELADGEAQKMGCNSLVVKQGKYLVITVRDFMKNIPAIGAAFQEILSQPGIDPNGYCVEWYQNNDVQCMVRLHSKD